MSYYGAPPPPGNYPGQYGAPPAQGQPPYGQQPAYGQQPPYGQQPQYGAPPAGYPPQGQYGAPPPPPGNYPAQYGAPPPAQPPYGQQPAYGQQPVYGQPPAPYGAPAPGYPPQPAAPYGAPAPYGQPAYGAPPQSFGPPDPPSIGYSSAPPQIAWDGTNDAKALRKAMKGFGTDERALISILATKDPLQIAVLRQTYNYTQSRNLLSDLASETSGYLEETLLGLARGPLAQDCHVLRTAMSGPGTKEEALNDVLLGRSNADLAAIKTHYQQTYKRSLEADLKSELSMKTERHFLMVIAGNRAESSAPVIPQQIDADVQEIYKATEGRTGTDELLVCQILTSRNDAQIGAIARSYEQKYRRSLEAVIKSEFSGHMERALLQQLRTGTDKAMRDAMLLEDAMAGAGTEDRLLLNRVLRVHWDRNHLQQVKAAYRHKFRRELGARIRGETSGDFEKALLGCIGE